MAGLFTCPMFISYRLSFIIFTGRDMYKIKFLRVLSRLVILSGCGLLVSCMSYRTIPIEIMKPATIELGEGSKVALLDRNISCLNQNKIWIPFSSEIDRTSLFQEFADAVNNVIATTQYTDSLLLLREQGETLLENFSQLQRLPADSIQALCERFNLDYIISIEALYFVPPSKKIYRSNNCFIRLYAKDVPVPLDSVLLQDKIQEDIYETENIEARILDGMWDMGNMYAFRIVPYWKQTERRIYTGGRILKVGNALLVAGKTEEARKIWENATKISGKKAIFAAINLAWIYENQDDFEQAISVISKAQCNPAVVKLTDEELNYLNAYRQIIEQRQKEYLMLNQQLSGEEDGE